MLAEIVSGIAIVVTVVLLIVEVRENTDAVRIASAQAVHENYANWYISLHSEPETTELVIEGLRDPSTLTTVQWGQFISVMMAYTSYMQNAFYQWQEGSLSPELWQGWELVSYNLVGTPGGIRFWQERSYVFGDTFREYVETEIMTKEPPVGAKPLGAFDIGP